MTEHQKKIVAAVQLVFLSPLVDQLTGFVQVTMLKITQHLFKSYGEIDEIDLKENTVKMMGPYDPADPLAHLIENLEKVREFAHAVGQTIADNTMVSKGITLLEQTDTYNEDIK